METRSHANLALVLAFGLPVGGCIIPDKGIVVFVPDPCGEQWAAQAVGAIGYNGLEDEADIKDADNHWLSKKYCFTPAQAEQLTDPQSELYQSMLNDIIEICHERAIELTLGDDNCAEVADVVFLGGCSPAEGCPSEGDDEVGTEDTETDETDTEETGTDDGPGVGDFSALDLTDEVDYVAGEYVVSQLLIDTALADPVGLSNDGTIAKQVFDSTAAPYGFEIDGVGVDNLGDVLGLQNGDIVTEINGMPTRTYDELVLVTLRLLSANTATVLVERGSSSVTLVYRRGT